jgi:hypothetical protein
MTKTTNERPLPAARSSIRAFDRAVPRARYWPFPLSCDTLSMNCDVVKFMPAMTAG